MVPNKFRFKVDVWGKVEFKNEMLETDYTPEKIMSLWAEVIPQTGSMGKRQGVETLLTNVTHKVVVRYHSAKDVKQDMWIMYQGHRLDIRFILNPYFLNETLEIFCEEVIG